MLQIASAVLELCVYVCVCVCVCVSEKASHRYSTLLSASGLQGRW